MPCILSTMSCAANITCACCTSLSLRYLPAFVLSVIPSAIFARIFPAFLLSLKPPSVLARFARFSVLALKSSLFDNTLFANALVLIPAAFACLLNAPGFLPVAFLIQFSASLTSSSPSSLISPLSTADLKSLAAAGVVAVPMVSPPDLICIAPEAGSSFISASRKRPESPLSITNNFRYPASFSLLCILVVVRCS